MSLKDDLEDYKLDTTFQSEPKCVIHKSYKVDRARGFRKVEVLERWFPHGEVLGVGAFGIVRLEKRAPSNNHDGVSRDLRAVKQLYKWQLDRLKIDFRKELSALIKFSRSKFRQYELFVEFWNWYENEESIFLAMEYFPLGTLGAFIEKKINEDDTRSIAAQLLEGLHIMHSHGFTHRDLKPENIFVVQVSPQWAIKIGDFGISKRVSNNNTIMQTVTGSPNYLAPEVHGYVPGADAESSAYTNAVDMWSFGCVIYEIFAINVPFPSYPQDIMKFCRGGPFPEGPLVPRASKEGIDFVKSALQPHPLHRLAASQMLDASWLQIQDFEDSGQSSDIDHIGSPTPVPGSSTAALEIEESEDIENKNEEGDQTITCLEKIVMPPLESLGAVSDTLKSPAISDNPNIDESKTAGPPSPVTNSLPEGVLDLLAMSTMKGDKERVLTSNKSATSLMIEYFEGGKNGKLESKRPSVRVRVAPSSKRGSKSSANEHVQITERKGKRMPYYTKLVQLSPNVKGDHLPRDQEGEGSKAVDSPESQPGVLGTPEVSMLLSNMVENISVNASTIREPNDDQTRGSAIPLQRLPEELPAPSIPLTTVVLEKQKRWRQKIESWIEEDKEPIELWLEENKDHRRKIKDHKPVQRRETEDSSFKAIKEPSSDSTRRSQSRERTPTLSVTSPRTPSPIRERSIILPVLSDTPTRGYRRVPAAEPLPPLWQRRSRSRERRNVKREPIPKVSNRFDKSSGEASDEASDEETARPRFRSRISSGNDGEKPSTKLRISRQRSRNREQERRPVAAGQPSSSALRRRSRSRERTTSKISLPYPSFSKAHSKYAVSASPRLPRTRSRSQEGKPAVPPLISRGRSRSRSRERVSIVPPTVSRRRSRSRERWLENQEADNRRRKPSLIPGSGLNSGSGTPLVDCNKPLPPDHLDTKDLISKKKVSKNNIVAKERSRSPSLEHQRRVAEGAALAGAAAAALFASRIRSRSRSPQHQRRMAEGALAGGAAAALFASQKPRLTSDPRSSPTSYPQQRHSRSQHPSDLTDNIQQPQVDYNSGTIRPPGLQTNIADYTAPNGSARRVMDFFRRRGKPRAVGKYERDEYDGYEAY